MSLNRPGFKSNLKANIGSTKRDQLFVKIPVDSSMLFRFLHPYKDDGIIWYHVAQHFSLAKEDTGTMAIADLTVHGTEETGTEDYINKLVDVLKRDFKGKENVIEKEIAKKLGTSYGWNAQVLVAEKGDDGVLAYSKPKILGLPRTGATSVNSVEQAADMAGEPGPFDVDNGFNIMITHHKDTPWYVAQRAGAPKSLDEILPGWEDLYMTDLEEKVGLKILGYDEQREAVVRTYGNQLDFEMLQSEYKL